MLLWVSAVGLAGAGWFGWLIWRDYDWSEVAIPGRSGGIPPSHSSPPQSGTQTQTGSPLSGSVANDLLGSTQTDWATGQGTVIPDQTTDNESVDDVNDTQEPVALESSVIPDSDVLDSEPETTQPVAIQPNAARRSADHEGYDVDAEDNTVTDAPMAVASSVTPEPDSDSPDEDFVVVGTSPALTQNGAITTADEDYVVLDLPGEELDDELPEIDLADYMNQWMPIVPKIAALITHELWPQLRSYLESLPQFGDVNLERVVNAVAEDSAPNTGDHDRVGEEASTGFAFYANLFDEMENGGEPVEVTAEEADLVMA